MGSATDVGKAVGLSSTTLLVEGRVVTIRDETVGTAVLCPTGAVECFTNVGDVVGSPGVGIPLF